MLDPVDFARDACEEAAHEMASGLNMVNNVVDKAQCFADIFEADTSGIDDF